MAGFLTILGVLMILGGIGVAIAALCRDVIFVSIILLGVMVLVLGICSVSVGQIKYAQSKCSVKAEEARTAYKYDSTNGCRLKTKDGRYVHDSKWRVTD